MDDKKFDDKIETSLIEGTKNSVELKEKIWKNIEAKINDDNKGEIKMVTRNNKIKNKKRSIWIRYGATAAILAIAIGAGTEVGQATIEKVKEFLVPEKVITEELEGMKEDTNVNLNESEIGYSIYFDENRYMIKDYNGIDRIVPKPVDDQDLSEMYYMEIIEQEDKKPEELAKEIEVKLKEEFENISQIETVKEPVEGLKIRANSLKDNNPLVKYYFIDNNRGGTFVFKQQLTIEAAEGHGVRFDNMLNEFRIDDSSK